MINIKGGVVSIGRNDTLTDVSISNAMVVVDMDDVKSEQEVKDWMSEHLDNVELHSCDVLTNEVYADFVMKKAEAKAKRGEALKEIEKVIEGVRQQVEPVVNYKPPLIERIVAKSVFWLFLVAMNVVKYFVEAPTFSHAVNAITLGCFGALMYFGFKRYKRMKSLMSRMVPPTGKE